MISRSKRTVLSLLCFVGVSLQALPILRAEAATPSTSSEVNFEALKLPKLSETETKSLSNIVQKILIGDIEADRTNERHEDVYDLKEEMPGQLIHLQDQIADLSIGEQHISDEFLEGKNIVYNGESYAPEIDFVSDGLRNDGEEILRIEKLDLSFDLIDVDGQFPSDEFFAQFRDKQVLRQVHADYELAYPLAKSSENYLIAMKVYKSFTYKDKQVYTPSRYEFFLYTRP
ncbi:MAG: hypothetical protein Q4P72_05045 [Eubacteriales bacterium]|nr:hypothetical protein [Eubacteriales bacterium]